METATHSDPTVELRYALEVLEEYCHLGLDDAYAMKLRGILERQITEAEEAPSCCPANPIRFPVATGEGE